MAYDRAPDKYLPISWKEALARIGAVLRALPHPNMAEFYTSGRTSNEAAFLYQLFAREYGTNNFPDCSNMPRGDERRSAPVARCRQRNRPAGGFRKGGQHLHLRAEPRHQQSAHD